MRWQSLTGLSCYVGAECLAGLQNVLGDASIAVDVDLSPLIGQLTEATGELKAHGQQDGLVRKLEHAVASLQGVQSLQKVKPTLLTAQQQVRTAHGPSHSIPYHDLHTVLMKRCFTKEHDGSSRTCLIDSNIPMVK